MNELSVNFGASEKAAVESAAGAEAIVDCVFRAILERRLPPAAKLSERVLCEVFRTSRSTVRRALLVLAERGTAAFCRIEEPSPPSPRQRKLMMMLPPTVLSLPAKLLFFVMIDCWNLLIGSLVRSVA